MSRINLTNLETVCCIARLGTFSAAADRLHTSQPSVTARVREIESALGIAFFQRRGRLMELTVEGRQFIERVEPLVDKLEEAVLSHSEASASRGVVRIGVGAVTMTWFADVMGDLKRKMPHLDYELDVEMGMNMISKLQAGKLDLAVVGGRNVRVPGMTSLQLKASQLQWVMSANVPRVVEGRRLPLGELLDSAPVWLMPRASPIFGKAVQAARGCGARLHNVNTCGSMVALVDLIEKGPGIGIVATEIAKNRLAAGTLVPVSDRLKPETLALTLLFNEDQQQAIVRQVADWVAQADAQRLSLHERLRDARPPSRARRATASTRTRKSAAAA
jgi:DNA-binding transcriptional LysR family regulator